MVSVRSVVRILGAPLCVHHEEQPADAAVVLGCRLERDGSLSPVGEERIAAGVDVWRRGLAPVLALTGGSDLFAPRTIAPGLARRGDSLRSPIAEAEALARRARSLGVPESALRVEPASRNTADNARFTAKILLPEGRRRVWVVTQPFHLRRALFWFRRAGFDPLGWHIADSLQYRHPPTGTRWVLREYVSWLKLAALEVVPPRR